MPTMDSLIMQMENPMTPVSPVPGDTSEESESDGESGESGTLHEILKNVTIIRYLLESEKQKVQQTQVPDYNSTMLEL